MGYYERIYKTESILFTLWAKLQTLSNEYLRTLRRMRVREPVMPYSQMQSGTWKAGILFPVFSISL